MHILYSIVYVYIQITFLYIPFALLIFALTLYLILKVAWNIPSFRNFDKHHYDQWTSSLSSKATLYLVGCSAHCAAVEAPNNNNKLRNIPMQIIYLRLCYVHVVEGVFT